MYSKLIAVTNRYLCSGDYLAQIRKIAALHPRAVILREKDLPPEAYLELAQKVSVICQQEQVPLYLHSQIEVARKLNCHKLHLSYANFLQVHDQLQDFTHISVSCHSLAEGLQSAQLGATQIVLGTIFATACKPGKVGAGLEFLQEVCEVCPVPVYAIGGINLARLSQVLATGAAGGCMMSGFMEM